MKTKQLCKYLTNELYNNYNNNNNSMIPILWEAIDLIRGKINKSKNVTNN